MKLKQFCDGIENYQGSISHYVTVNVGAAVGLAMGSFLASGKPACVYMQNSGIGNAVNLLASLTNGDVYGIPRPFTVGWRWQPLFPCICVWIWEGARENKQHFIEWRRLCGHGQI